VMFAGGDPLVLPVIHTCAVFLSAKLLITAYNNG
jgi:hypothetical protein